MKHNLLKLLFKPVFAKPETAPARMKLRFDVNQAEAFRRGIDWEDSVVTLEIDRTALTPPQHALVRDRLLGIDVCECEVRVGGRLGPTVIRDTDNFDDPRAYEAPMRIVAPTPDLAGLLEALADDAARIEERLSLTRDAA